MNRDEKREAAIAEAKAEDEAKETALAAMVRKLDARPKGHTGVVLGRDELIAILHEVTPLLAVAVLETNTSFHMGRGAKEISVEIQFGLTLERDLL